MCLGVQYVLESPSFLLMLLSELIWSYTFVYSRPAISIAASSRGGCVV